MASRQNRSGSSRTVVSGLDSETASSSPPKVSDKDRKKAALGQLQAKRGSLTSLKRKYQDDTPGRADVQQTSTATERPSLPLTPPESPARVASSINKHEMESNKRRDPMHRRGTSRESAPKPAIVFEDLDDSDDDGVAGNLDLPPALPAPTPIWQPKSRPNFAHKHTTSSSNTSVALPRTSTSPRAASRSHVTSPVPPRSAVREQSEERRGVSPVDFSFGFLEEPAPIATDDAGARLHSNTYFDDLDLPPPLALPTMLPNQPSASKQRQSSVPNIPAIANAIPSNASMPTQIPNPSQTPLLRSEASDPAFVNNSAAKTAAKPQHTRFQFVSDGKATLPAAKDRTSTSTTASTSSRHSGANSSTTVSSGSAAGTSAVTSAATSAKLAAQSKEPAKAPSKAAHIVSCQHCEIKFTPEGLQNHLNALASMFTQLPSTVAQQDVGDDDDEYHFSDIDVDEIESSRAPLKPVRPPSPNKINANKSARPAQPPKALPTNVRPPSPQLADQLFPESVNGKQSRLSAKQKGKARAIDKIVETDDDGWQQPPSDWFDDDEIVPLPKNRATNQANKKQTIQSKLTLQPAPLRNIAGHRKAPSASGSTAIIDIDDEDDDDDAVAAALVNTSISAKAPGPSRAGPSHASRSPLKGSSYLSKLPAEVQDFYWNLIGGRPNEPVPGRSRQQNNNTKRKQAAHNEEYDDDEDMTDAPTNRKRKSAAPSSRGGASTSSRSELRGPAASTSRIKAAPMRGGNWFSRGKRKKGRPLGLQR